MFLSYFSLLSPEFKIGPLSPCGAQTGREKDEEPYKPNIAFSLPFQGGGEVLETKAPGLEPRLCQVPLGDFAHIGSLLSVSVSLSVKQTAFCFCRR